MDIAYLHLSEHFQEAGHSPICTLELMHYSYTVQRRTDALSGETERLKPLLVAEVCDARVLNRG